MGDASKFVPRDLPYYRRLERVDLVRDEERIVLSIDAATRDEPQVRTGQIQAHQNHLQESFSACRDTARVILTGWRGIGRGGVKCHLVRLELQ